MKAPQLTLNIPPQVDTLQLSAAIKATVAADIRPAHDVKVNITSEVSKVSLAVQTFTESGEPDSSFRLIEPNAIVRYLSGATELESPLITFEESELYQLVSKAIKLDSETATGLSKLLPEKFDGAGSIIAFGDLHALVMARGKPALAVEASVLMWHQKMFSDPKIKLAMVPAMKTEFIKPPKNEKADKPATKQPQAAAASAGESEGSAASDEPKPAPVEVPHIDGPGYDEKVKLPTQEHPILPKDSERNILITSALPYVNNVPHLGNIVGSTLSADFYSRYCKARGYNTLFICGTDEYGTATETKALEENCTPLELCTHFYNIHKQVYDWFDIEFDHFGRTSTPQQTEIAQDVFNKLLKNGYLEEKTSTQLFCEEHQGFLADRYVEGICPKCQFPDARGDQCDGCGQLLDPFELINPRCKLDDKEPVSRETKHMFLKLDALQPKLEQWHDTKLSTWPKNAQTITKNWTKEGLQPRSITRDLKWGTPVPLEGYENKVLYVWFDAPIGYPSITANYTEEWAKWWKPKNSEDIELYQFMGKDNAPFHAVVWPSSEIGADDNWKLVDYLSTTEYLQYEGGKFSKSRNLGVFGNNVQEIGISPSVWRYYLANARPETGDSQFAWADFVLRNNSELLANLGNFVNRLIKFAVSKYDGRVPKFTPDTEALKDFNDRLKQYNTAMEAVQIRDGIELAMRFSARGNQYLQDSKMDNNLFLNHPEKCAQVVGTALNIIYVLSAMIYPYMPQTSQQIVEMLNVELRLIPDEVDFTIEPGHKLGKPQYLFSRIDSAKVAEWQAKYGGGSNLKVELDAEKKAKKEAKKQQMKSQ